MDFGRCLLMSLLVSPGHVVKLLLAMALVHVEVAGLKQHLC
jgi:hypothetical protein